MGLSHSFPGIRRWSLIIVGCIHAIRFCPNFGSSLSIDEPNFALIWRSLVNLFPKPKFPTSLVFPKRDLPGIKASNLEYPFQSKSNQEPSEFRRRAGHTNGSADGTLQLSEPDMVRLERSKVRTFDGTCSAWISLRDLFKFLVHDHGKLSGIQKYLRASVKGKASQQIDI